MSVGQILELGHSLLTAKGEVGEKYCIGGNTEKNNFEIAVEICNLISKKIDNQFNYKDLIKFVNKKLFKIKN